MLVCDPTDNGGLKKGHWLSDERDTYAVINNIAADLAYNNNSIIERRAYLRSL